MIAAILSVSVLLGAAGWGEAAPQYSGFHHHQSQLNVHPHHHHQHQIQFHHHEQFKKEVHMDNSASHSVRLEDPEAKRPPRVGLLLITQNPIGLCRTDNFTCPCYTGLSQKRLTECGNSYPLWTVDSLWQGKIHVTVARKSHSQSHLVAHACNKNELHSATIELRKLPEEEQQCLRYAWPPLKEGGGDCNDDSAIIYQGTIQGNCSMVYEHFSSLHMYYSQVADLYRRVNGPSDFCKKPVKACGNNCTATSDTDTMDTQFPLPTDTPALHEQIHTALTALGLNNTNAITIHPADLQAVFGFNVYIGCMQPSRLPGQRFWILTRVGFCFRCPRGKQPCDNPQQVNCWTDTNNPPTTIPWAETNNDQPCYTGRKQVCYCGFDKTADCTC